MNKLGIIGAMKVEVDLVLAELAGIKMKTVSGIDFYEGALNDLPVVVAQCGVGKVNAAICAEVMCSIYVVTHLVNTGIAGSLCAALDIGDFVISENAMYHDFDCSFLNPAYAVGQVPDMEVYKFPADNMLLRAACEAADSVYPGHYKIGTVASGDQFVGDKKLKDLIVKNTNALCTEMEGAAIAHTAWRNGVPFVIIRSISDKADDSAQMDYPTFEAMAAKRCAAVTINLSKTIK